MEGNWSPEMVTNVGIKIAWLIFLPWLFKVQGSYVARAVWLELGAAVP